MAEENPNLLKYLDFARLAVEAGRPVLLNYFGRIEKIEEKHKAGLVSEADKDAELAIISVLQEKTPDFEILAEESGRSAGRTDSRWIIDPLDGTTNYIHRLPFFAISLGLELSGEVVVGIVDIPMLSKTFHAVKGQGAFLNGEKLQVTDTTDMTRALFGTGFAGARDGQVKDQIEYIERFVNQTRGVRRYGSAAIDLCMVAEGCFDGFWEACLNPWDVAAGALIVFEAGGVVTDYGGEAFTPYQSSIVATNGQIHEPVLGLLDLSNR